MKKIRFSFPDLASHPRPSQEADRKQSIEVVTIGLDVEPDAVRAAAALLSEAEQKRALRFSFECDRRRYTVARSQLRQLLAARLNVHPRDVELVYGKRGKPALSSRFESAKLHFNVAHADDVATFAFARGLNVGVDIEAVRELRDADDIARRFFSRREYASYQALGPYERPLGFFTCWTRKEAFVKALGDGLYHPLDAFDTFDASPMPPEPVLIAHDQIGSAADCKWLVHSFSPGPGLVGAVVAGKRVDARDTAYSRKPSGQGDASPLLFS